MHQGHDHGHSNPHNLQDSKMVEGIRNALLCSSICLETKTHCLKMGGKHAEPAHIQLLDDCAKICETAANFMARSSENHGKVCGICAEICEACAESCEAIGGEEMERCAEACRKCAESCRAMAA